MTDGHETIIHELQGVAARLGGNASRGNGSSANEDMLFICRSILHRLQDSGGGDDPPATPSMTNAQKLGLTLVPAAQQAGAIKVSGGDSDGIYPKLAAPLVDTGTGRQQYVLVGQDNQSDFFYSVVWNSRWEAWNIDSPLYYSLSDVATPDLATNWKNVSDDTAASITVALATGSDMIDYGQSVQVTDGFVVSGAANTDINDFWFATGTENAKPVYHRANSTDPDDKIYWNAISGWIFNADGAHSTEAVAYPWLVTTWIEGSTPTLTHPAIQTLQPPSDSFVVSGDTYEAWGDGRYRRDGLHNGRLKFTAEHFDDVGGHPYIQWDDAWAIHRSNDDSNIGSSGHDTFAPWQDDWSGAGVTLTPSPNADPTVVVVSGAGTAEANGIYTRRGTHGGCDWFNLLGQPDSLDTAAIIKTGSSWRISASPSDGDYYNSTDDVAAPWLVTTWSVADVGTDPAPTVTAAIAYPALFVSGAGTAAANGIYTARGLNDGKPYYNLLGQADDLGAYSIYWNAGGGTWTVTNSVGDSIYNVASAAAFPWFATFTVDGGTAPAPTLTPITAAELAAGLRVSNDGATNGASYVSQPFHGRQYYMGLNGGGSNNLHWDTDFNVWTDDVGEWTASNVAFPWQGADAHSSHNGATFARNDVASEASWSNA